MRSPLLLCAIGLVLLGCQGLQEPVDGPPPEGSVDMGNDIFMAPAGADETGCPRYTAWSAKHAVMAVIQYRKADGSFSPLRSDADC